MWSAASLCAQEAVAPEEAAAAERVFEPNPTERALACTVRPRSPVLTFRLVHRAGYSVTAPMEQLMERPRMVELFTRITPEGTAARPVLLKDSEALPENAGNAEPEASKFEARFEGRFLLGEGAYHVELAVAASGRRVCRKQWDVAVKTRKNVADELPPGKAVSPAQLGLPRPAGRGGGLTVFLHAASAERNPMLLESLAAVVARMPFRRVRVIAFSLDQHKELARQELTGPVAFARLAEALRAYAPSTVSYGVLQDTTGHRDFLWKLLAQEGLRAPPDQLAVFVGYSSLDDSRVFVPPACGDRSRQPLYAYLEYALPRRGRALPAGDAGPAMPNVPAGVDPRRGIWGDLPQLTNLEPVMPDAISRVVRKCSGKVFPIRLPADLAAALDKLEKMSGARRGRNRQ